MFNNRDFSVSNIYIIFFKDKFNNSRNIMNPCGFQGYSVNKTKEDLFQAPCVKGDFAKKLFGNEINPNLTTLSKSFF